MAEPARADEKLLAAPGPPIRAATTARRRLLTDRAAHWVVTTGGLAVIASILAILAFILGEVWPLSRPASVTAGPTVSLAVGAPEALAGDEYRTHVVALGLDGWVRSFHTADGGLVGETDLVATAPESAAQATGETTSTPPRLLAAATPPGSDLLTASTDDGRVVLVPLSFAVSFEGQTRNVQPRVGEPLWLAVDPNGGPITSFAARLAEDGTATAAAQLADGRLRIVRRETTRNLLTGEESATTDAFETEVPYRLSHLLLDGAQRELYGGTPEGGILWWSLEAGRPGPARVASAGPSPITALSLLVGDRSLIVGQENGSLSVWFVVRQPDETMQLVRVRDFPRQGGAIALLSPSRRDKGFLVQDGGGEVGLYYSTSHRTLWRGRSPLPGANAMLYSPKADGAFLAVPGVLARLEIRNPHPEVSLWALFGKVWYEGHGRPEHVWQSTGGTTDFESKFGLTPLIVGTLKGTFYALVLAVPLGVLGAMYASQFLHPSLLRYIKPTVEIMAALPTVVLGFLAGLWLAPRVEQAFPALILALLVLPLFVLGAGAAWRALPAGVRHRYPAGAEVGLYLIALAAGLWLCFLLSHPFEAAAFGDSFPSWLLEVTGLRYDQRNAIVVGLAMGFAVTPIIFAISEDAFSNVPRNLTAGSLALGATRWQTVTRVVLPTASPGIFSAVMIGFGRAVGETMIVLMATGNTPIMSWSPFDGFRTLSANIAVEIPEAPHGGTLYRVLFIAALLLFVFTFVVNTLAEIVRQHLREKYSRL